MMLEEVVHRQFLTVHTSGSTGLFTLVLECFLVKKTEKLSTFLTNADL